MHSKASVVAISIAALVATGCGKSDEKPADVPLENAAEACAAIQSFYDSALTRCGYLGTPTAAFAGSLYGADPQYDCATWTAAVTAGTATYDRAKALVCNDALNALTCGQVDWLYWRGLPIGPYECAEALRGTLAGGATCAHDFECATGICDLPAACDVAGSCVAAAAAPALDQPCAGVSPFCAGGLVCDTTITPTPLCKRPPVVPTPVASGSCANAPCVDGSWCNTSDQCVVRPLDGMSCNSSTNPCAYGTRCAGGFCQAVVQPGGACAFGEDDCAIGASCVVMGTTLAAGTTCANWPREGGVCGPVAVISPTLKWEWVDCLDSWCDGAAGLPTPTQGTCKPFVAVGATCDPAAGSPFNTFVGPCGPLTGYDCNGTTPTCKRLTCNPL